MPLPEPPLRSLAVLQQIDENNPMLVHDEFVSLQRMIGTAFTLDGFANNDGSNAFCNKFCCPQRSFFDTDISGETVWMHPPLTKTHEAVQHAVHCHATNPQNTHIVMLLPDYEGPWQVYTQRMKRLASYPAGSNIFNRTPEMQGDSEMLRTSFPMAVFSLPRAHAPLMATSAQPQPNSLPLTMMFPATANGASITVLVDSGAKNSYMSQACVERYGFATQPLRGNHAALIANGNKVSINTATNCNLTLGGTKLTLKNVHVMPLCDGFDIILGEDWCTQHKAQLNFAAMQLTFTCNGVTTSLQRKLVPSTKFGHVTLISPSQMAKELKSDLRHRQKAAKRGGKADTAFAPLLVVVKQPTTDQGTDPISNATHLTAAEQQQLRAVVEKFGDVFQDKVDSLPPDRDIPEVIPLEPGAKPVYQRPRRYSRLENMAIEQTVKEALAAGLIQHSQSAFASPVVLVPKKDGTLRMCVDYRALNKITTKNRHALPRVEDLFDRLNGAGFFTTMDLASGYNQVKLPFADIAKTAFTTPTGHYEYLVMPFGLCNAPAAFQALMNKIFRDQLNKTVLIYLDDILVFSRTFPEHLQHLRLVLSRLRQHQLRVKLSKCSFAQQELSFLGHIVTKDGIKADPEKVQQVAAWPQPTNVHEIQSFLGLAGYFKKFIPGYASLAAPMHDLTQKGKPFVWTDEHTRSFTGIKQRLTTAPLLRIPDPESDEPFTLMTDASLYGTGAVLLQGGKPCAYDSKKFIPAERNYSTTEQEGLAVIRAVKKWRPYLEGAKHKFIILTDHAALRWLFSTKDTPNRRVMRWITELQGYDFDIRHLPGKVNIADPLSRKPDLLAVLLHRNCAITRTSTRTQADPVTTGSTVQPLRQKRKHTNSRTWPEDAMTVRADAHKWYNVNTGQVEYNFADPSKAAPPAQPANTSTSVAIETFASPFMQRVFRAQQLDTWLQSATAKSTLQLVDGCSTKVTVHPQLQNMHSVALYIPDSDALREHCMRECHDSTHAGHGGTEKSVKLLLRHYWWPTAAQDMTTHVRTCDSCQRMKARTTQPGGLLQPLQIPADRWHTICMDFITSLPVTDTGHDGILVVSDKLTKWLILIPVNMSVTSTQVADLLDTHVFCQHGIPKHIVCDRDPRFTSNVFRDWAASYDIQLHLSSGYHPQTNGQSERFNRVIEDTLRHYVSPTLTDWNRHLPRVAHAMNNSYHSSIQNTPFFLNKGDHPPHPMRLHGSGSFPANDVFAERVRLISLRAKQCMRAASDRQAAYYNQRHKARTFQEGDKVLLSSKNFTFKGPHTKKLMPRYIGPYTVLKKLSEQAYKLELPPYMTVHDVFHVSLLEPYRSDGTYQPPVPTIETDGSWRYEIEAVLDHRHVRNGHRQYLCKWKGQGPEHNSWETESSVQNEPLVQQYLTDKLLMVH